MGFSLHRPTPYTFSAPRPLGLPLNEREIDMTEALTVIGVEAVVEQLHAAEISVWLDSEGKLRIDKEAPPEMKELVRENKQALLDVKTAVRLMNAAGVRIIRLPLGHLALAYLLGTELEQIRWAMKVLGKESMPLVINDEGLRSMTCEEWKLRQPACTEQRDDSDCRVPEMAPRLEFGRKTA